MLDLKTLTATVQRNCHISDAQYAGQYTLCIFLLKMREYYRWERTIPLPHSLPKEAVGDWLTERENFWDTLDDEPFSSLTIGKQTFAPFETDAINTQLNPLGFVYSAGIGIFHKPYFFLAELEENSSYHGIRLLVSGKEYARDMVAPPAMLLGNTVYIRRESLRRVIWERIDEWRLKKRQDTAMARALACYTPQLPTDDALESILDRITDNELKTVLLHEAGEAQVQQQLGPRWEELLTALPPRSIAELIMRAVRDHWADSLSTLPALLKSANHASLHFYFANLNGLRRELYPEILLAYQSWLDSGSLARLEELCQHSPQRWQDFSQHILELFSAQPHIEAVATAIENLIQTTNPNTPGEPRRPGVHS